MVYCEVSGKGQQQHLDPQTVFSRYLKILSGCLNMTVDFWKTELCSLCITPNQKDITLVFLFPVVDEKRAMCCLGSSHWAVCAASTGTSFPCAAESLLSLRHLAVSAWQGNGLCSIPERIKSQTEIRISISGNWQQESWKPSDRVGTSSVYSFSLHKWRFVIHKVHILVSCTGSSAAPWKQYQTRWRRHPGQTWLDLQRLTSTHLSNTKLELSLTPRV